ncbi:MAG: hypothetical protein KBB04_05245 [Methanothrix sp.]|jgi:hypothetical protein|uniref:hypothetical protein n=1 Tax=Methanothrix sp. TaxID=90426 RepID=UPI001B4F7C25|nr:hypothetical protein [Methanothrix sp.]MBP7067667.1 hypothetical protein [Methanothrix sp.]
MIGNELKPFLGKILRIDIKDLDIPLYGKLIEVTPYWIDIERKNGSNRIISKARIVGIEPVRAQSC